jgi:hypothetical protein
MNYLSDKAYIAFGKQVDAVTPVVPNIFVPFIEEDLKSEIKNERIKQISAINWNSAKVLQGERSHGGSFTVLADPDTLAHLLNMCVKKGATTGDATIGYTTPFTIDDSKYYTIEVLRGNSVARFVGAQISKIEFGFDSGHLTAKCDIVARNQFSAGTLKTALTGIGMVAVVFDTQYDQAPATGLVIGDVIQVWTGQVATDIIVATIASDKKSITCTSTNATAIVGSLITLKGQTPTFPAVLRPFNMGRCLVGFGADITAAIANAATYALATPLDEIKLSIDKGIENRIASGSSDPILLNGVPDGEFTTKKLFETAEEQRAYLDLTKKACAIVFTGDEITAGYSASLTIKLHDIRSKKLENKIKKGEYVYDETDYTVEYDQTAGKAIEITLVNKTAGTAL